MQCQAGIWQRLTVGNCRGEALEDQLIYHVVHLLEPRCLCNAVDSEDDTRPRHSKRVANVSNGY